MKNLRLSLFNNQVIQLKCLSYFTAVLVFIVIPGLIIAQPSGGPYGPIPKSYDLPEVTGKIYYVAPGGQANEPGSSVSKPSSLERAIGQAITGDAIILRGGVYRTGNLVFNQGITLQAYADEQPILKGTAVASDWEKIADGLWLTKWEKLFPMAPQSWWRRNRNATTTPLHRFNNDMVFIDGKFLQSADWTGDVDENSYYIHYETGEVYIGVDPTDKLVEITTFDVALKRITGEIHGRKSDKKGPVIRGITFTQYAYRAIEIEGTNPNGISEESNHGKEVVGTTLEHCSITYCSRVAAYLRGDQLTVRHCKISHTSTEGLFILSSSDVLLEKNIFAQNNIEKITGYFPAAVKIFNQCYRVTCNDNLVIDHPYSNGIWYDVGNVDGVFTNNWVERVGLTNFTINTNHLWPSENGFFFEISKGAICAGNVFVNCDHGVMVLNSSKVEMYNNTFINSMATIGRDTRSAQGDHFGWHPATGPDVDERDGHVLINNIFSGDDNFSRPLLFIWQKAELCDRLIEPELKEMNNNLYLRSSNQSQNPLILWGPSNTAENCQSTFNTLEAMQKNTSFEANSQFVPYEKTHVFKSPELGNYRCTKSLMNLISPAELPERVSLLLGKSASEQVGAFPGFD